MAATEPYHFAAQIGQKQYELSNHLGNVQATVNELPYMATFTQPGSDVPGVTYEPSLRSAYDYYPFWMLMPGHYVSDTTERCMTISRTGWSTILVDSCKPLGVVCSKLYDRRRECQPGRRLFGVKCACSGFDWFSCAGSCRGRQ